MNFEVASSAYDSASSRTHPPHAGAALKSISNGLSCAFASASAASTSLFQLTAIFLYLLFDLDLTDGPMPARPVSKHALRRRFLTRKLNHSSRPAADYSCL